MHEKLSPRIQRTVGPADDRFPLLPCDLLAVCGAHGKQVWRSLKTNDRLVAKQEIERVPRGLRASGTLIKKKLVPTFLDAVFRQAEACERDGMRPAT